MSDQCLTERINVLTASITDHGGGVTDQLLNSKELSHQEACEPMSLRPLIRAGKVSPASTADTVGTLSVSWLGLGAAGTSMSLMIGLAVLSQSWDKCFYKVKLGQMLSHCMKNIIFIFSWILRFNRLQLFIPGLSYKQ